IGINASSSDVLGHRVVGPSKCDQGIGLADDRGAIVGSVPQRELEFRQGFRRLTERKQDASPFGRSASKRRAQLKRTAEFLDRFDPASETRERTTSRNVVENAQLNLARIDSSTS